jgi:hypothetical protein
MQEVVSEAPDLPHSPIGGPWALDAPINQGSYLFNLGNLSEQTVDDWIKVARQTGMNQIDFTGESFRLGDYQLNPKSYPHGMAGLKTVIDKPCHNIQVACTCRQVGHWVTHPVS